MTSEPSTPHVMRPWTLPALASQLMQQAGLSWRWIRKGFPLRPPDWESAGVHRRQSGAIRGVRGLVSFLAPRRSRVAAEFLGVVLMMALLFVMLMGSFGTAGFGIPALFFPDKPTVFPEWEWSWILEQLFTGIVAGWLLFHLCFACYLLHSREWLKWRGPLSIAEANDPSQPHRLNQYLSATWSVVFTGLVVALLLGGASGTDWLAWVRTGLFIVGVYCGGTVSWWWLLRSTRWQRGQGGMFAWLRSWCTRLTLSYRRLKEARPLHPDVEGAHAIGTLLVSGLLVCWVAGFIWPDAFSRLPTAVFICLFLGLIAAVFAFFQFHGFTSTLAKPLLVVAAVWIYKAVAAWPVEHQYESLHYDHLLTHAELEDNIQKAKSAPEGLKMRDVLKAWRASDEAPRQVDQARPPRGREHERRRHSLRSVDDARLRPARQGNTGISPPGASHHRRLRRHARRGVLCR